MKLFGFTIERKKEDDNVKAFSPPSAESAIEVNSIDSFSAPVIQALEDTQGRGIESENQLIDKYREVALIPEVDFAVEEITSEAIIQEGDEKSVEINLDRAPVKDAIKKKINECFDDVYNLLDFNTKGSEIFKRWYVDGRIFYAILIDDDNVPEGIQELRFIDPKKIKKIREFKKQKASTDHPDIIYNNDIKEYYLYASKGIDNTMEGIDVTSGIPVSPDSIAYCNSGILDYKSNIPLSFLHKALRAANNLRMLEDAVVIYRLTRAPERRIFYVDVGNLPREAASRFMRNISSQYKNKVVYDVKTGEVTNDRNHLSMTEDFWIPRRDGGQGTQIDTLPGGENLGQIEDVEYFRKKLSKALNVPHSRMESEGEMFGRGTEITRDELRFARFIQKARVRFSILFNELMKRQVVLKGVMTEDEWEELVSNIHYDFQQDNYFTESLNADIWQTRMNLMRDAESYIGVYFSKDWARREIFKMGDEEIATEDEKIQAEGSDDEAAERQENEINFESHDDDVLKQLEHLAESKTSLSNSMSDLFRTINDQIVIEDSQRR